MKNATDNKPFYKRRPIGSIAALARALNTPERLLVRLGMTAGNHYRVAKEITKPDGSIRIVYDVREPLKSVLKVIHCRLFSYIEYPQYLSGGIKGRSTETHVAPHVGAQVLINEDISNFFPSITCDHVRDIWLHVFHFPFAVADLLARLTTFNDTVPQGGASTSTDIANLVMWMREPSIVDRLSERGLTYTRFVDDIAISSHRRLAPSEIANTISAFIGLVRSSGFRIKRCKQQVLTQRDRMETTGHVLNRKISVRREYEQKIRVAVIDAERLLEHGAPIYRISHAVESASGRIEHLSKYRPSRGRRYRQRIDAVLAAIS